MFKQNKDKRRKISTKNAIGVYINQKHLPHKKRVIYHKKHSVT